MVPFGTTLTKFVSQAGLIVQPWIAYLQQFTIPPPSFLDIDVGLPSGPTTIFEYEAKEPGYLSITGGTIITIILNRGTDTITMTIDLIPVAINDIVVITYSGAVVPTIKFIPSYGQNTTS